MIIGAKVNNNPSVEFNNPLPLDSLLNLQDVNAPSNIGDAFQAALSQANLHAERSTNLNLDHKFSHADYSDTASQNALHSFDNEGLSDNIGINLSDNEPTDLLAKQAETTQDEEKRPDTNDHIIIKPSTSIILPQKDGKTIPDPDQKIENAQDPQVKLGTFATTRVINKNKITSEIAQLNILDKNSIEANYDERNTLNSEYQLQSNHQPKFADSNLNQTDYEGHKAQNIESLEKNDLNSPEQNNFKFENATTPILQATLVQELKNVSNELKLNNDIPKFNSNDKYVATDSGVEPKLDAKTIKTNLPNTSQISYDDAESKIVNNSPSIKEGEFSENSESDKIEIKNNQALILNSKSDTIIFKNKISEYKANEIPLEGRSKIVNTQVMKVLNNLETKTQTITVQLEPEYLGKIDIRMEVTPKGESKVSILADKLDTYSLLTSSKDQIQAILNDKGFNQDSSSLNFGLRYGNENSSQNNNNNEQISFGNSGTEFAHNEKDKIEILTLLYSDPDRVDLIV